MLLAPSSFGVDHAVFAASLPPGTLEQIELPQGPMGVRMLELPSRFRGTRVIRGFRTILLVLITLLCAARGSASLIRAVGVDSNICVDEGRVLFLQAGGSLTALDLQTGEVIKRITGVRMRGVIVVWQDRIFIGDKYADFTLVLDRATLEVLQKIDGKGMPFLLDGNLLRMRTAKRLELVDALTGATIWGWVSPEATSLLAVSPSHVLLGGGCSCDDSDASRRAIRLLSMDSLETVYTIDADSVESSETSWLQEDRAAFLTTRESLVSDLSSIDDPLMSPPSKFIFRVLDASGRESESVARRTDAGDDWDFQRREFVAGGYRFLPDGRFLPEDAPVAAGWPVVKLARNAWGIQQTSALLETSATLTVAPVPIIPVINRDHLSLLKYKSHDADWRILLPYSQEDDTLEQVAQAGDLLLISSTEGYLECLDRLTGASRWVYAFPESGWLQWQEYSMPAALDSVPDRLDRAAYAFDKRWAEKETPVSCVVVPASIAGTSLDVEALRALRAREPVPYIRDPAARNFARENLRKLLPRAWAAVFLPLVVMAVYAFAVRRWKGKHVATGAAWVALICWAGALAGLVSITQISDPTAIAAKGVVLMLAVTVLLFSIISIQRGRVLWVALPVALVVGASAYFWRLLIER